MNVDVFNSCKEAWNSLAPKTQENLKFAGKIALVTLVFAATMSLLLAAEIGTFGLASPIVVPFAFVGCMLLPGITAKLLFPNEVNALFSKLNCCDN